MDLLGQGDDSHPGMARDGEKVHEATQDGIQFRSYELFISEIFHLIFSDHGWPQATETTESKSADKGDYYIYKSNYYTVYLKVI